MRTRLEELIFGTTSIVYSIRRSGERDTIAITVGPDAAVSVVAPKGLRRVQIAKVVSSKAPWILRQQDSVRRHHRAYPKEFISGESVYYLGRQYKLKVLAAEHRPSGKQVVCTRGEFRVTVRLFSSTQERARLVREALIRWLKGRATDQLTEVTRSFASKLGLSYSDVQICEIKKRWGSGSPSGKLRFNWRIIMAPRRLVEYVVAHELCHLRHNDHSREFWRLLERVMPDYERRRSELEKIGPKLDLPIHVKPLTT
jgi:predicted metal-dependent hydrolase